VNERLLDRVPVTEMRNHSLVAEMTTRAPDCRFSTDPMLNT